MFFNVSREKSGRSGDVIGRGLGHGCVSLPTRSRSLLHVEKPARGTVYKPRRSDRENCQQTITDGVRDRRTWKKSH